ncbi:hypothetical protein F4561_006326 [Lipingzhangella halophila]|uniref:Helix-turn-helix domain-containing protein n=1 Tax=Lipingzhangella halophila TaxID=1783352 RepID=A0A7W7RNT4_9ACTN|nr:helix-turn-helix domain-containing protein [Lipingzhangella halophila]MBB4935432.1 hypothetical protein [Lipingzhangella halophila]
MRPLTITELYALPAAVDLMTAAQALNMGRTMAYELAKNDEFPCRIIRYGNTYRVRLADILHLLDVPVPSQQSQEVAKPSAQDRTEADAFDPDSTVEDRP